ncbi:MAG: tripartite tricarboxylate transporter substrate binding protein [Pusillimonas sp.]
MVSFSPGGTADILARNIAQEITGKTGISVIVENKPGGGGSIATEYVARSAPDGLTMLLHSTGAAIAPHLHKNVSYDLLKDLTTVTPVAAGPFILLTSPEVPAKTVKDFLAYARQHPGELNFGTGGMGSTAHLTGEKLKLDGGVDIVHVPFKGGSPAMAAVAGNQVQFVFEPIASSRAMVEAKRIIPLAVTSETRSKIWPELPSIAEAGVDGFDISIWYSLFLPAGTPENIKQYWNETVQSVLNEKRVNDWLLSQGMEPMPMSLADAKTYMATEYRKWGDVIEKGNISVE